MIVWEGRKGSIEGGYFGNERELVGGQNVKGNDLAWFASDDHMYISVTVIATNWIPLVIFTIKFATAFVLCKVVY